MSLHRRGFLSLCAGAAAASMLAGAGAGSSVLPARPASYPFRLGVASGAPVPDGMVLWTRLILDPLADTLPEALAAAPIAVRWEVADDEQFRHVAARGVALASPQLAHSVHVEVGGLAPARWYWYRFLLGDAVSPVARTRTAPPADSLPASLRFVFASCQHWEFGQYGAHRHIAASDPDLVVFLGDYIYEWGPYELAHPQRARRSDESFSLRDYRARYAQYKSDPHLQAAHHAAPWLVTWDDHEVANDYAGDRDERLAADFHNRRAAAYQAFYEHMPVRLPALPGFSGAAANSPERFGQLRLFGRHDWGRLARFHLLDGRQYRAPQACAKPGRGGSNSVDRSCAERVDAQRSLLGAEQERWLAEGFAHAAGWNILAQQTLMAPSSQVPAQNPGDGRYWTDGWDGYPAARARLLADVRRHKPANPVVISGDVHTFYAAHLRTDVLRPVSAANPLLATEFCGTSVTSSSRPQERIDRNVADNPHLLYGRSDRRGFVMMEVTPRQTVASFRALDDVSRADSGISTCARFVVESGRPVPVQDG
jgi:alkaline phosphatase D